MDRGITGKCNCFLCVLLFRLVCWRTFASATAPISVRLAHKNIVNLVRNEYCTIKYRGMDDNLNWQKVVDRNEF